MIEFVFDIASKTPCRALLLKPLTTTSALLDAVAESNLTLFIALDVLLMCKPLNIQNKSSM